MTELPAPHVKFLGTASALPLPSFDCFCFNCEEARSGVAARRTRSSIAVVGQEICVVDAGPDLELQMEREGLRRIDRLFITHWHTDHMAGLGGLGLYQTVGQWPPIKLYLHRELVPLFTAQQGYQRSSFELHPIQPGDEVHTLDARWEVVGTNHALGSVGFIINAGRRIAYLSDGVAPPQLTVDRIQHSDVLVLEATMDECDTEDPAHFSAQQAAQFRSTAGIDDCLLTHASFHSRFAGQRAPGWSAETRREFAERSGLNYAVDGLVLPLQAPSINVAAPPTLSGTRDQALAEGVHYFKMQKFSRAICAFLSAGLYPELLHELSKRGLIFDQTGLHFRGARHQKPLVTMKHYLENLAALKKDGCEIDPKWYDPSAFF